MDSFQLDEDGVCSVCRTSLTSFDTTYSYGTYEGSLQKLIQLFKYGKVESLAGPLSNLLLQSLPFAENFGLVMAMPMHWRKRWDRGFNQAELLARPVASRLGVKLASNLRRTRLTKPQAGLNERERRANLKDSFVVKEPLEIAGKRVLLIDDVFTTGATLRAAAEALKGSGVAGVTALTLARVDSRTFIPESGGGVRRGNRKGWSSDTSSASTSAGERKILTAGTGAE